MTAPTDAPRDQTLIEAFQDTSIRESRNILAEMMGKRDRQQKTHAEMDSALRRMEQVDISIRSGLSFAQMPNQTPVGQQRFLFPDDDDEYSPKEEQVKPSPHFEQLRARLSPKSKHPVVEVEEIEVESY